MRNITTCSILVFLLVTLAAQAQEGQKAYRFLNLPTSTRVNALGGSNVSLVENDISLVFHNPSLLGEEMNMNASLGYMSYIGDIGVGSAIFGKSISPISSFAVGANFVNYGKFTQTSEDHQIEGDFSAKDIALNGVYSRDLTEKLRGGVTAKFLYSSFESYSSVAIGFDVGLSYYNEAKEFSTAIVFKNIGAQLSSYDDKRLSLPWDLQVGLSKKMNHAPIRISVTGVYLNQWKFSDINEANGVEDKKDNFTKTLFKHLVFGVDFVPSQSFWAGVGYNPKTNSDMKILEGNKWGGWSLGAGVRVSKFNLGFSMAPFHPSATSYHFNVGVDLSKF